MGGAGIVAEGEHHPDAGTADERKTHPQRGNMPTPRDAEHSKPEEGQPEKGDRWRLSRRGCTG